MPRLTGAQRDRSTYLGASDFPVLAGVSPYATPFELYLEKIGELDRQATRTDDDLARMERGHRLEDVALATVRREAADRPETIARRSASMRARHAGWRTDDFAGDHHVYPAGVGR